MKPNKCLGLRCRLTQPTGNGQGIGNGTELITQLIFLFPVPCSLSQRVNLILSDYLKDLDLM